MDWCIPHMHIASNDFKMNLFHWHSPHVQMEWVENEFISLIFTPCPNGMSWEQIYFIDIPHMSKWNELRMNLFHWYSPHVQMEWVENKFISLTFPTCPNGMSWERIYFIDIHPMSKWNELRTNLFQWHSPYVQMEWVENEFISLTFTTCPNGMSWEWIYFIDIPHMSKWNVLRMNLFHWHSPHVQMEWVENEFISLIFTTCPNGMSWERIYFIDIHHMYKWNELRTNLFHWHSPHVQMECVENEFISLTFPTCPNGMCWEWIYFIDIHPMSKWNELRMNLFHWYSPHVQMEWVENEFISLIFTTCPNGMSWEWIYFIDIPHMSKWNVLRMNLFHWHSPHVQMECVENEFISLIFTPCPNGMSWERIYFIDIHHMSKWNELRTNLFHWYSPHVQME